MVPGMRANLLAPFQRRKAVRARSPLARAGHRSPKTISNRPHRQRPACHIPCTCSSTHPSTAVLMVSGAVMVDVVLPLQPLSTSLAPQHPSSAIAANSATLIWWRTAMSAGNRVTTPITLANASAEPSLIAAKTASLISVNDTVVVVSSPEAPS